MGASSAIGWTNHAAMAFAVLCAGAVAVPNAPAQMVTGAKIPGYAQTFRVELDKKAYPYSAHLIESSIPGNVLWPGEQATFTVQLVNNTDQAIQVKGKVDVIQYGTKGRPGDVWVPDMFKIADVESIPVEVNLPAKGFTNVAVSPKIPATFGAYGLVVDLGEKGRQFFATCVRTFQAKGQRVQYPKFCLDVLPLPVLKRLGVQAVRHGVSYKPTTDKDFDQWFEKEAARLKEFNDADIAVLFMVGGGAFYHENQPLGRPRPWLDGNDTMMDTKFDLAWLPSWDDDFQKWVKLFAGRFGWPKGSVNAFSLWNEPWEGISISGWGADMSRYRELYARMALGVEQARKEDKVDILVGGCDSTSNAQDKLFGDGGDEFLKWFDFCSIHYQGMAPHSTIKAWVDRKSPNGRVKIWDTESWVANTDDRVAAVVAVNRSAGYDRAMGIYGGNIAQEQTVTVRTEDGKGRRIGAAQAWSVAAAVGASQHFIGERDFKELLFRNGLPWVILFDGLPGKDGKPDPDDGTVVVVGDIGEEFGPENILFRTARGLREVAHKEELKQKLATMPANANAADRAALEAAIHKFEVLSGATMTIEVAQGGFSLYDFYGNAVPTKSASGGTRRGEGGKIVIPLDGRGFFLRTDGAPGSFAALVEAVRRSRIEGIEPLATVCHDMTAGIDRKPTMRLVLTNVLNRPVSGTLTVKLGELKLDGASQKLDFAAHQTKEVLIKVIDGAAAPNNTYPLALAFDAGADGKAVHEEDMHVNVIAKRTINVDGNLDDWKDIPAQAVSSDQKAAPTLTEAAWFPFMKFDETVRKGFATGYLAYDKDCFYFAAKAADDTPDDGMPRFETRNDEEYYYPQTCYMVDTAKALCKKDATWAGVSLQDARALRTPDGKDRIAAGWETEGAVKAFAIDLKLPPDQMHQVALYFMDPGEGRSVKVEVLDPNGKVLDSRDVGNFRFGKYAVYNLAGELRLRIKTNSWQPACVSGIFFDPVKADAQADDPKAKGPKTKADKGKSGQVRFVKLDEDTQGNWNGVYGTEGHNVIATEAKYPSYVKVDVPVVEARTALKWPEGVRRYSYRRDPELPAGNAPRHDNFQIAFNVLPEDRKPWYPCPPGTMPRYTTYRDTDYEYALNPVAARYGGGGEIWRLAYPAMPHKHNYPRQGKTKFDGPVKDGRLVMKRDGNTRIVECAIPWSEIPEVRNCLDEGRTIKFSFRVNDNGSPACMELSRLRSVAKRNGSFHVDWTEHWANELEFAFEK